VGNNTFPLAQARGRGQFSSAGRAMLS
jgi:hypothetical protein